MNVNFLDKIISFNIKKNLYKNKYRPEVNAVNILDELLEMIHFYKDDSEQRNKTSHYIVNLYKNEEFCNEFGPNSKNYKDFTLEHYADFLDDNIDTLIYAIGDMIKILNDLGLFDHINISDSEKHISNLINIVAEANLEKTGEINQDGKLEKQKDFIPPNQKIIQYLKENINKKL